MRPIDKTAFDLFQKLRARYSPVTLGNESAESTSDPEEARFFNFTYKEEEQALGPITISLIDGRSMKVFYGEDMVHEITDKANWYNFLRELRGFAKRNLLTFDARDVAKSQLDSRDFNWLSDIHGKVDQKEVSVSEARVLGAGMSKEALARDTDQSDREYAHQLAFKNKWKKEHPGEKWPGYSKTGYQHPDYKTEAVQESAMFGSKRRSYQTLESVKLIVQHSKTVDESVPGARSRSIHGIYLERADGERYKFPYNYLTGARAMARHISEGGTPYDPLGQHVLSMIKEMRDLSKFARMTKTHALEDAQAGSIRERVVERFQNLKGVLGSMSHEQGYRGFAESFKPTDVAESGDNIEELRERFTRKVWDTAMEDLLPSVQRALRETEMLNKANQPAGVKEADAFASWANNVSEGLSDSSEVAQAIIGDNAGLVPVSVDEVYQAVSDYMGKTGDQSVNKDEVAQIIMDKFGLSEATTSGTVGTQGTQGTQGSDPGPGIDKAKLAQSTKNITRMAQGAGLKTNGGQVGKMVQAIVTGQQLPRGGAQTMVGLGNQLISSAMSDPKKAATLTAMLKRMKQNEDVSEEFDNWFESEMVTEKELHIGNDEEEEVLNEPIPAAGPTQTVRMPRKDLSIDESIAWLLKLSGQKN